MADTSLVFNIIARDKVQSTLNKIKKNAGSTGAAVAKALGPAATPMLATAAGGMVALGASFAAAGVAAGVFGGVLASSQSEVTEAATKVEDLHKKMELYGRSAQIQAARGEENGKMLKKQAAAALELEARLSLLPPATRAATMAYLGMKSSWSGFVDKNKPATFGIMTRGYGLVGKAIAQLQPFFDMGAAAANRLLDAITPVINGGGLSKLAATAGPSMKSLTNIIINVATAITRTFGAFASDGPGILRWIEQATARWAAWSNVNAGGGIREFVTYFREVGPRVVGVLADLATAAMHVAQAVAPLAPISLAVASALAAIIGAVPAGVIQAIVAGWIAYGIAIKAYTAYLVIAKAVQWAMNAALLANPVTWVVIGIIALIAVIVLVATKTKFFQTVWKYVWGFMKSVGAWFAGPFAGFFVRAWGKIVASLNRAKGQFMGAVNFIKNLFWGWARAQVAIASSVIGQVVRIVNFIRSAPGRIRGALAGMFNPLWSGFRNNVNRLISGWNNLSFGIPGFSFAGVSVPGISVGTPDIPYLATGGNVMRDGMAYLHAGEQVTKRAEVTRTGPGTGSGGGGGGSTITISGSNTRAVRVLLELLREGIRDQGGDVVRVLTPR